MDTIISFLEKLVHYSAELGIVLAELAGIAILIITAMKGVVSYFKHNEHLRLIALRGVLTLLLHWEIKVEEEHDERLLKLKAMEEAEKTAETSKQ